MRFTADLHIHSRYSRATSQELVPQKLALWAQKKGIQLLGTGDFTHPAWVAELRENLVEAEQGLFRLRPDLEKAVEKDLPPACRSAPRFILTGELSCIYKKGGKTRKVHHLILMPGFEPLERFNRSLGRIGNIKSDGRPILGLDSRNLLEMALEASESVFFIPAHIWTPWFSLFGSKSGFESIEECFEDLSPHIHALETGLSSDPAMNGLFSELDGRVLVSNSDAHSPAKLGREANLFQTELDYTHVTQAMTDGTGFLGTVEFFPEEGKYHLDGHRKCGVCFEPEETSKCGAICPKCGKLLTVGVLSRVHELADRDDPVLSRKFFSAVPLTEILSEILSCGPSSSKVASAYETMLERLGPELPLLMECPLGEIEEAGGPLLSEAVRRMRANQVIREGGYDGEYGVIRLFDPEEKSRLAGQFGLFAEGPKSAPSRAPREKRVRRKQGARETAPPVPSYPGAGLDPVLDPLNPEQRRAVLHDGGHLLIVAGPGTGKTMTLTHRIARLVRAGVDARQVLALTFTNKAAREMEERIRAILGGKASRPVRVRTFHRFCLDLLREEGEKAGIPPDFLLCSEWDARRIAERVVSETNLSRSAVRAFYRQLPSLKRERVLSGALGAASAQFLPLLDAYQKTLSGASMLDLEDLETEALRFLRVDPETARAQSSRFSWIFVDEYQDTNPVEAALLKRLVDVGPADPSAPRVCAIGDPDQAIYGFRGAEVGCFHNFETDFPGATVVHLARNYRSTQNILSGAASILRKEQPLEGVNGQGGPILIAPCRTAAEEAEVVVCEVERVIGGTSLFSMDSGRVASSEEGGGYGFGDVAVLFRLNAQGQALEEAFSRAGIPYVRSGEKPLVMREPVHSLWRSLLALAYPDVELYRERHKGFTGLGEEGERILGRLADGEPVHETVKRATDLHAFDLSTEESRETLRRLEDLASGFEGDLRGFLDLLSIDRGIDHEMLSGDRVSLMSLHASKGLEWPVVFITGCEDGLLPCTLFSGHDEDEERRLFYVGMTRARHRLFLSFAERRLHDGRALKGGPSPLLNLVPRELQAELAPRTVKKPRQLLRQMGLFTTTYMP